MTIRQDVDALIGDWLAELIGVRQALAEAVRLTEVQS